MFLTKRFKNGLARRSFSVGGFTLIEILVVIGIIGILIGLGAISYATAQKKARDSRRKTDLQAVQTAYEQYYSVCGFAYPVTEVGAAPSSVACVDPATTILPATPLDPLGSDYEIIAADVNGSSYTICPPVVRTEDATNYRLETENCTDVNNTCCLSNVQ